MKKFYKYSVVFLMFGIVAFAIFSYFKNRNYQKAINELQNELAKDSKTIEIKDGLYRKEVIQSENIANLLDTSNKRIKTLLKELNKKNEKLLTANSTTIRWKKAYEATVDAKQEIVKEDGKERIKVSFKKDFGYIGVNGYTLTNPSKAWVKIKQNKPLVLTSAISQNKKGKWFAYSTSSEKNVDIELNIASVNPFFFKEKWYEKIGILTSTAFGDGLLYSTGLIYNFDKFDVGPSMFVVDNGKVKKYYGVSVTWKPFKRKR